MLAAYVLCVEDEATGTSLRVGPFETRAAAENQRKQLHPALSIGGGICWVETLWPPRQIGPAVVDYLSRAKIRVIMDSAVEVAGCG